MSDLLRIVKVGGSLLALGDLAARLRQWISAQPAGRNVLIAGGGELAEEVRRWDERFQLGQERSHWLCADLLDVSAHLLHHLLPETRLCRSVNGLADPAAKPDIVVLAPAAFLHHEESGFAGDRLPHTWEATTDSIAARVADVTGADELVLLKSSLPKSFATLADLSGEYVDSYFAWAARPLAEVRFVNLREPGFPEVYAWE
jgi:aspartokinase-like uncharacterized kinase